MATDTGAVARPSDAAKLTRSIIWIANDDFVDDEISVIYERNATTNKRKAKEFETDRPENNRAKKGKGVYIDDDVYVLDVLPRFLKPKTPHKFRGEFSNSKPQTGNYYVNSVPVQRILVCEICYDEKPERDVFRAMGCTDHSYCFDCVAKYIATKLDESITSITCPAPGCNGLLDPEFCRSILPTQVYTRWGDALCESTILGSNQAFYCPYNDCSALMINETGGTGGQSEAAQVDCPHCKRALCVDCKVPWHSGFECKEFKEGLENSYELKLHKLAERKGWKRCPNCKIYVQKTHGCNVITCRCGGEFSYLSGRALLGGRNRRLAINLYQRRRNKFSPRRLDDRVHNAHDPNSACFRSTPIRRYPFGTQFKAPPAPTIEPPRRLTTLQGRLSFRFDRDGKQFLD